MLIEFSVTNFRSFRDKQTLSLLPLGKIRERKIMPLQTDNYAKLQVLPTAVLYGANNAGKSNFLKAMDALERLVTNSGNFNSDRKLTPNEFFELDINNKNQPTTFEIDFIAPNQRRYRYVLSFNERKVLQEELYVYNNSGTGKVTIKTLYERTEQTIKFVALKGVRESVRFEKNQLFLSRADIEGNQELQEVYSYFAKKIFVFQFSETEYIDFLTKKFSQFVMENQNIVLVKLFESVLKSIDLDILGIETQGVDISKIKLDESLSQEVKDKIFDQLTNELKTRHKLFDGANEIGTTTMSLNEQSVGTRKLLGLLPFVLQALLDGATVFIDEMNTSLHTEMTSWLIDLFNNKETNPNNAQLIITTHDIVLISKELYERDQIYIVEKDKYGSSELSFFGDITGLRGNHRLSDYYETGRLGGVPHISKSYLQHIISQYLSDAKTKQSPK